MGALGSGGLFHLPSNAYATGLGCDEREISSIFAYPILCGASHRPTILPQNIYLQQDYFHARLISDDHQASHHYATKINASADENFGEPIGY